MLAFKNCSKCELAIQDTHLMVIKNMDNQEKYFHDACLACSECGTGLEDASRGRYAKNDLLYCGKDYTQKYGPVCSGCQENILYGEEAHRLTKDVVVHSKCLNCSVCLVNLPKGSNFSLDEVSKKPLCEAHTSLSQQQEEEIPAIEEQDEVESEEDSKSKKRTPRTKFTEKQTALMLNIFAQTPRPTRLMREQMAKETSLPIRCIQIWFQNKRSKEKRQHHKRFMTSTVTSVNGLGWYQYHQQPQYQQPQAQTMASPPNSSPSHLYPTPPPSDYIPPLASPQEVYQAPPSFEAAIMNSNCYPSPPWNMES
jgi:hypothetical protein